MLLLCAGCGQNKPVENDETQTSQPAFHDSSPKPDDLIKEERPNRNVKSLKPIEIPNRPVSGTIAGRPFKPNKIQWQGSLDFEQGKGQFPDLALTINNIAEDIQTVAGKTMTWSAQDKFNPENPSVTLKFKPDRNSTFPKTEFLDNYRLQLQFGAINSTGEIDGKISFETKDKPGGKFSGKFSVKLPDNFSKTPQAWYRPWVVTRTDLLGRGEHQLQAGFIGKTADGDWKSNMAGTTLGRGEDQSATSLTFLPQVTTIASNEKLGIHARHLLLSPGNYIFYVAENEGHTAWKIVEVKKDSTKDITLLMNNDLAGTLTVEVSNPSENQWVYIAPLTEEGQPPFEFKNSVTRFKALFEPQQVNNGKTQFKSLASGHYRVYLVNRAPVDKNSYRLQVGKQTVDTKINTKKTTTVKIKYTD